jgi:hypothetical protein
MGPVHDNGLSEYITLPVDTLTPGTLLYKHVSLCHEVIWGSGGISPPTLISARDGGEWSASRFGVFTPRDTPSGYPLDRRLGGPQSRSGCYG